MSRHDAHLTAAELAALLADPAATHREHLGRCPLCSAEVAALTAAVAELRNAAGEELPAAFWEGQRVRLRERRDAPAPRLEALRWALAGRRGRRWAWATGALAGGLLAALVVTHRPATAAGDDALLRRVESALAPEAPSALVPDLAPAEALLEELAARATPRPAVAVGSAA
jgi:anti-sigma factor RsiW